MNIRNNITTISLLVFVILSYAQKEEDKVSNQNTNRDLRADESELTIQNGVYTDYVTDELGNRLEGILVKVRGSSSVDVTDVNGEFSVRAKKGDVIMLSKDGKRINTYVYDGSSQYKVADESEEMVSGSKFSKKRKDKSNYRIALDSANFHLNTDQNKSIQFVEEALKNTTNKNEIAASYEILADAYTKLKQYDLARSNYEAASRTLKRSIPLQIKLARSYYQTNAFTESNKLLTKIVKSKGATSDQKIVAYELVGNNYTALQKYNLALKNYQKGLALAEQQSLKPKITLFNTQIAEVYDRQGNIQESETFYNNSIEAAKNENKEQLIVQSNRTADFYGRTNNVDKELELRKESLKNLEEVQAEAIVISEDEKVSKPQLKYDIANTLVKQKNYEEAITYFEESADDAESLNDVEIQQRAIKGLTEAYVALGDDDNALLNYKKLLALTDVIYKQKEDEIREVAKITNELLEKQTRINSLELDRKLNESKLQLYSSEQKLDLENAKRQRIIIYSLLGGLLLLIVSLFYMFRSNKQKKLANNLLALKSLRSQMNPHFIFNALNSVNSFIASNDERTANRYLTDFSTLMRSVLENSEQDFISLSKEIELLELYLKLEHTRFKDKFDFELNIDGNVEIEEFQIPPMLLQPYVENAVWHGLRYKEEKGLLQVNIKQQDKERLAIEIIDDGIGRQRSKALKSKNQLKQKSTGMQNIKKRVAILNEMYQDKIDVIIEDLNEDETGTKVVLTLLKD